LWSVWAVVVAAARAEAEVDGLVEVVAEAEDIPNDC
jgi:hypothetical protein